MKIQKQLKMFGSMEQLLGMLPIPGMNKEMRQMIAHGGEGQFKKIEAMVNSMTPQERREPDVLMKNKNRQKRIAKGCGQTEEDIAQFMQQFDMMRMMMKQFTGLTDSFKPDTATSSGGFSMGMPRSNRKKNKGGGMPSAQEMEKMSKQLQQKMPKSKGGFPGFPGGFPNFPGGGGFPFK
jgi:signal recognition particle subunit SRP54